MSDIEEIGHRLYRRAERQIIKPAQEGRPEQVVDVAVYVCGFYSRAEVIAAYAKRGELEGGLPRVDGLRFELMAAESLLQQCGVLTVRK